MTHGSIADLLEPAEQACHRLASKYNLGQPLTAEEKALAETLRDGAENTLEPLLHGLEALGEVMTLTHATPEVIPKQTLSGLGWLLITLAGAMETSARIQGLTNRVLTPEP
jgi:hypothetical protein